ncbi:isoleucine--tRNA ligase [Actinomarinicola tropica]|uniref:Isoleucine--tRNA ligase n=2 Tax=Actinomarinicola tropica TaxID=2789776 RepID=A0A5Q2RFD4_9ACTN|nr:isoleucine--tRNA ligase [Actinomarinicola tropica]QGG95539.1 isoleucine--tRNA ligase [Actinomarinicola tropica]
MTDQPYPTVDPRPSFPEIERRILDLWARERTFERSIEQRDAGPSGENEYVFYDGPPFANGLPHYGHLLTGYVKDVVPRYQTMRGRRVERRFGWDCHGLPVEMEVEKELQVQGRAAIQDFGIDRFNDTCRTSVMRYTSEWEDYVTRQARWVDFTNDYKTMDLAYMESVMWAFKQLWDKGLVYEAHRVMPYSWGAETPLSNFEIRLDDATRPRQDPALTVSFTLDPRPGDPGPMRILAWTTTPWTLPSNLALAVGPDLDYAILEEDGDHFIIGAATLEKYAAQLEGTRQVGTIKGSELVGRTYEPLLPYFADTPDAFRILAGDFIDTAEGTGVVHIAPGFGEDDQRIAEEAGIGLVVPVDDAGRFTEDVPEWAGQNVLDANPDVIRHLKELGRVVKHETYEHNYPHCWRTDTPIIYRALSSWYVRVTDFRDRMVELNQEINWIPEHVRDGQFGKWIAGARDWSISRNRFWGSPIPVWKSDDPQYPRVDVYGSLDELERDFGVRPTDLHRPAIDELVRPNPDDPTGRSMMRRVPEVLDCWFESGSMPFAQVHYPFENREWFDDHHPGDFIVEYIPQTRGWFYTLHVLATALFDTPAFRNVICHGIVLDSTGRKQSKRLRNYPDPEAVFEQQGADALRWYLMSSPILRGGDLRMHEDASDITEVVRQVLMPVWNAYSFFTLYANADERRAERRTDSTHVLDRYVLAKAHELVAEVTERMDALDIAGAAGAITSFIDALNNWYIRRSRERFWGGEGGSGSADAHDTLYTVLTTLMRVAAPLLPLVSEEIYRNLTGEPSVHLTDWPDADDLPADPALVAAMDRIRDVCTAALFLREDNGLRTRLPLSSLVVAGADAETLRPYVDLVRDEVNVKSVELTDDLAAHAEFILKPNGRVLGPKLGGDVQKVMAAARSGEWSADGDRVEVAGHVLEPGEFDLTLRSREGEVSQALRTNDAVVVLDVDVTPELAAEGRARDLVRIVQQARKDADLVVTDRIDLRIDADGDAADALAAHRDWIATQVLATTITEGSPTGEGHTARGDVDGSTVTIEVRRAG